jgi:hypothetical protein
MIITTQDIERLGKRQAFLIQQATLAVLENGDSEAYRSAFAEYKTASDEWWNAVQLFIKQKAA